MGRLRIIYGVSGVGDPAAFDRRISSVLGPGLWDEVEYGIDDDEASHREVEGLQEQTIVFRRYVRTPREAALWRERFEDRLADSGLFGRGPYGTVRIFYDLEEEQDGSWDLWESLTTGENFKEYEEVLARKRWWPEA